MDANKNIYWVQKQQVPFIDIIYQKVGDLLYCLDVDCTLEIIIMKSGEGSESLPNATTATNSSVTGIAIASQKDINTEENLSEISSQETTQSVSDVELEDNKSTIPHREFASLHWRVAQPILPTMCTKVAVKHKSPSSCFIHSMY